MIRRRLVISVFFFQAEDGIRDIGVTGVQTCALPICAGAPDQSYRSNGPRDVLGHPVPFPGDVRLQGAVRQAVRPQSRRAAPADRPRTTVPDRPRPLLLDPQGRAARAGARGIRRLDQRGAAGSVRQPLHDRAARVSRRRRTPDREGVSARSLESDGRVALHSGERCSLSPVARSGLHECRLLALHPTDHSGGARAGGPLGRHHEDRVRAPHLQREAVSGDLVDRVIPEGERAAALERAGRLRSLTLDPRTVADLELIATGGYSPLKGFLGSADYQRVIHEMRLADGRPWPVPLTLRLDAAPGAGEAGAAGATDGPVRGVAVA